MHDASIGLALQRDLSLKNATSTQDIYRIARAFVDQFIASYAASPEAIVLEIDHSENGTQGQQKLSFYNHHYRNYCGCCCGSLLKVDMTGPCNYGQKPIPCMRDNEILGSLVGILI